MQMCCLRWAAILTGTIAILLLNISHVLAQNASNAATTQSDLKIIAERLTKIRDIARAHEQLFDNVRVTATFKPANELFTLTIKGLKGHYDQEVIQEDGRKATSYWLDDGTANFSFSRDLLIIDPPTADHDELVSQLAGEFGIFQMPVLDGDMMTVSKFCESILDDINQGNVFGRASELALRETATSTEIEVRSMSLRNSNRGNRLVITLDNSKNYVMSELNERDTQGQLPSDFLFEKRVRSNYKEVAPGAFYISSGTWTQKRSGSHAKDLNREIQSTIALDVKSVEFGDFTTDETVFDIHSWPPIHKGISVYDKRVTPPLRFVYAQGPIDSAVLEHALRDVRFRRPMQQASRNWLLICLNILVVIATFSLWIARRFRGAKTS